MDGEMERFQPLATRLYDAAVEGDLPALLNLLQEDPLILDRCNIEKRDGFTQTPLHIAANLGHLEFVVEILRRKPELAEERDHSQRSALHVSSAKGHLEVVRTLLAVNPDMCLVRDQDGRNPFQVAATKGHIHVLNEIFWVKPQAARERTNSGETVLHLCMKHSQVEALKFLVNIMDDGELLNFKDIDGNTVLHLAVATKQPEMVKFILTDKRMGKNVINSNGLTAMDTYLQSRKELRDREIWGHLKRSKALRAKDALRPRKRHRNWLDKQSNALMVVASLIATMAFQVGVNPPGGAWQDDDNGHRAGSSIMADKDRAMYDKFLISNMVALVSSLSVILLLISGLPCKRIIVAILMITMWIAVSGTTLTYLFSVEFLTSPKRDHEVWPLNYLFSDDFLTSSKSDREVWLAMQTTLGVWLFLMILLLLGHGIRFIFKLIKQLVRTLCTSSSARIRSHPPV